MSHVSHLRVLRVSARDFFLALTETQRARRKKHKTNCVRVSTLTRIHNYIWCPRNCLEASYSDISTEAQRDKFTLNGKALLLIAKTRHPGLFYETR